MKCEKYTCCRCGAAADCLDEISGTLYCADCADNMAFEKLYTMSAEDRLEFVGLVPLGDE